MPDEQERGHVVGSAAPSDQDVREQCAKLVQEMIHQYPWNEQLWARSALAIAARTIRRGRHLMESEKLLNLARAMEEADAENGTNETASLIAKLRSVAGGSSG